MPNIMSGNTIVICKKCSKQYRQICVGQEPGIGERDYDICPYCSNENGSSKVIYYGNTVIKEDN